MKLTDIFVKRPVLAIVVNLVILIAGVQSIRSLAVRQYPRSDIAVITVSTVYVGANADLVRGFITTPLERVIASADGIDYMESSSAQDLSAISGVQRADILGGRTFAMRVWLKADKMAALHIAPSQVRETLARNNYLSTLGRTKGSMVSVNLVANTDLKTAEEFRQLVVKKENGGMVRLGEIADVVLGAENYDQDVRFRGQT